MKKEINTLCVSMVTILFLTACNHMPVSYQENGNTEKNAKTQLSVVDTSEETLKYTATKDSNASLPETIFDSYYAGQNNPAFPYFQNTSIKRFLAMWVKEQTGDIENPKWNYDSFTKISILDHDLAVSRPEEELYCCTFSDGLDRYGYIIVSYDKTGPSLSNWGVMETTPYLYDLKTYEEEIAQSLKKTDIDLPTAKASRIYLYDRQNKLADQVILFTDDKGDNYICYFGEDTFEIEKW